MSSLYAPNTYTLPGLHPSAALEKPLVFDTMRNHEGMSLGGRLWRPSAGSLAIELMLFPQTLKDCPNRIKWAYNANPLSNFSATLGDFSAELAATPNGGRLTHAPSGTALEFTLDRLSREDGTTDLTFKCDATTRFYGLGEQFASLDHTGRKIVCESADWWNKSFFDAPGWKHSYIPIPFLLTNAGYGLLIDAPVRVSFDLSSTCSYYQGTYHVRVESAGARLILIPGATQLAVIQEFLRLTGRPYLPPRWALEPLLACASNHKERVYDQRKHDEYIQKFSEHKIPNGLVMDESWIWLRKDETSPTGYYLHSECYGAFEPDNMDDPKAAVESMWREGRSRTIFIIGPFIGCASKYLPLCEEKGWLVRRVSSPELPLQGQYNHFFFDFTNPEAVEWWKSKLREVMALGIHGFFCDFAEADEQMDALYFRGTGRSMGQVYNMLYKQAVVDVLKETRGEDYYLIARSGWTGLQALAGCLQGDFEATFDGMRQAFFGMLSNAMSGLGFVVHNLGGYGGTQTPDVYLRWVGLGLFSPMWAIWTMGETGGEPWNFGDATVLDQYRTLAQWRMRLLPYLHSGIKLYHDELVPLVRPMLLAFANDGITRAIEDQYMCGPELLVAPVFSAEGGRTVYLPEGPWHDFWTGAPTSGPASVATQSPMDRLPVFVRGGGIVPMEANPYFGEDLTQEVLEFHLFGPPAGRSFPLFDQGHMSTLKAELHGGAVALSFEPLEREAVAWVWHGCERPTRVELNGSPVQSGVSYDDATRTLRVELPGRAGGVLRIQYPSDTRSLQSTRSNA